MGNETSSNQEGGGRSSRHIRGSRPAHPEDVYLSVDGPGMSRAMTFDERRLLQVSSRKSHIQGSTGLKRAVTFVSKSKLQRRQSLTYDDVLYRRHFGASSLPVPMPVVHGVAECVIQSPAVVRDEAVVVIDTFSTGASLASQIYKMGYKVICVMSGDLGDLKSMIPDGLELVFSGTLQFDFNMPHEEAVIKLLSELQSLPWPVVAVLPGAETGVELSDEISSRMGVRTNGTALTEARRNKYVMGETVRSAGLRAVKQKHASTWGEIAQFIENWNPNPFKVIVKPMDSAGSDDVTLCLSMEEVQKAFGNIIGKVNGLGLVNKSVLVQEYLEGQEYVVDMVSRDGVHKVVGIWLYDRRPANGANFVCHGQRLMLANEEHCQEIIAYQKKVITALGIVNGPTHGEVKWFQGEPVLVEVGSRCHGGDGFWTAVADECMGYNQVKATAYAYLDPEKFDALPDEPLSRRKFGHLKWLVNYKEGTLVKANIDEIVAMTSYRGHQVFPKPGSVMKLTQNCFTWAGCVRLVHEDEEELMREYYRIQDLQQDGLFTMEEAPKIDEKGAVAVVDPFSTGAVLAAYVAKMGYKCIGVYSAKLEQLGHLQNLVPQGLDLSFDAIVGYDSDTDAMIAKLKESVDAPIVAVLAGAETGVELSDLLSSRMKLRTNGTELSEARRNKYVMGETIRKAGVRAVKQLHTSSFAEVEQFVTSWNPDPFKVIVKPMDSAGSDGVTLCRSMEEVKQAFDNLIGKVNGLGLVNKSILVQEYLDGQEYVIDMVSLDGVHKVAGIWAYDRRPANGASFVLHGQRLMTADEEHCQELIDYQKKVITALGIVNGPTHGEVKWFQGEPVLVEVGSRCHGSEGSWVKCVETAYGYNQVSATAFAYLAPEKFKAIPELPLRRLAHGGLVFLVVRQGGVLAQVNPDLVEEIRQMKSFVHMEIFPKPGDLIKPTIDCFTFGGLVELVHEDELIFNMDYSRIRDIENENFFVLSA